jgi:hypothetical protein
MNIKKFDISLLLLVLLMTFMPVISKADICKYSNNISVKTSTGLTGAGVATGLGLKMAGVTALTHSSGAAIVATSSGGYVAGTLGVMGSATAILTAPLTLVVGGITAVTVGSTLAYCYYKR